MGIEYAMVHVYTITPALLLTVFYRPLLTTVDSYKVAILIAIAVIATIPWDSYLIRQRIWTYPPDVIIGPTLFEIPAEELFFFVIQTYTTSFLYLVLSKATFHPAYLRAERGTAHPQDQSNASWRRYRTIGQLAFACVIFAGICMIRDDGCASYLGLIVCWAAPFLLLLWTCAYQFILGLPLVNTVLPIMLPTFYLWYVDTLALQRGTWVIEPGTKLGIQLWEGLEIEEAIFFLVTNTLVVFGLLAFDNAISILDSFPSLFPDVRSLPSPIILIKALLMPASKYDVERILAFKDAVGRLKRKSRSFYFASSTFNGRLRIDIMLLYSWCRVADDLVDDAPTRKEAQGWIDKLEEVLRVQFDEDHDRIPNKEKRNSRPALIADFPQGTHLALALLPVDHLCRRQFEEMLLGFQMDLKFSPDRLHEGEFDSPIATEEHLEVYAYRVAGTVARLCLQLVFYHLSSPISMVEQEDVLCAGARMGMALQYVNIARDIAVDAKMYRIYLPQTWLKDEGLTAAEVIKKPNGPKIQRLRSRLLDRAFDVYEEARGSIEKLPREARGPIRVAVESYMEIGRVLREEHYIVRPGRATVPMLRRTKVALISLNKY